MRGQKYGATFGLALFTAVFAYVYFPIAPALPLPSELHEVTGKPDFANTSTIQMSDTDFTVSGTRLSCSLGQIDGWNGCEAFASALDKGAPVRATYFWMPTRLWYAYRVLNTLEQNGHIVVSSQQTREMQLRSYSGMLKSYWQLLAFFSMALAIAWIAERNVASGSPKSTEGE